MSSSILQRLLAVKSMCQFLFGFRPHCRPMHPQQSMHWTAAKSNDSTYLQLDCISSAFEGIRFCLKCCALFFSLMLYPVFTHAQNIISIENKATNKDRHAIQLYYGSKQTLDENLSVVVHQGRTLGLDYSWRSYQDGITESNIKGAYTSYMHPLEFEAESFSVETQLSFSRLKKFTRNRGMYIGAAAALWSELMYFPYWDEQHVYWATSGHVAAAVRYELYRNNATHSFTVQTPLLSFVSRPAENRLTVADDISTSGFAKSLFSDLEVGSLNQHAGVTLGYEYLLRWKKRTIGIVAELDYHRVKTSQSLPFKRRHLLIGTRYQF